MKHLLSFSLLLCIQSIVCVAQILPVQNRQELWYDMPAQEYTEALPLGNEKWGAMVYGIPHAELIQLSEEMRGEDSSRFCNAELGTLRLVFSGHEWYSNYRRSLDLDSARVLVEYQVASQPGVSGPQPFYHHRREIFCPMGDSLLVIRLTTDDPKGLSFVALLTAPQLDSLPKSEGNDVSHQVYLQVVPSDGLLLSRDGVISVMGSQSATIYVSGQKRESLNKGYDQLWNDHVANYQEKVNGNTLWLGPDLSSLKTTNVRLNIYPRTKDAHIDAQYYRFCRYSLITHCQTPIFAKVEKAFGGMAQMEERLWKSDDKGLYLLPALPDQWRKEGRFVGRVDHDRYALDMEWKDGKIIRAVISSFIGGKCRLYCNERQYFKNTKAGKTYVLVGK